MSSADESLARVREELRQQPDDPEVWRRLVQHRARAGELLHGLREVRQAMLRALAASGGGAPPHGTGPVALEAAGPGLPTPYQRFLGLVAESGFGLGDPGAWSEEPIRLVASDPTRGGLAVLRKDGRLEVLRARAEGSHPGLASEYDAVVPFAAAALGMAPRDGAVFALGFDPEAAPSGLVWAFRWRPGEARPRLEEARLPDRLGAGAPLVLLGADGEGRRLLLGLREGTGVTGFAVLELVSGPGEGPRLLSQGAAVEGPIQAAWVDPAGRTAVLSLDAGDSPLGGQKIRHLRLDLATGTTTRLHGADQAYPGFGFGEDGEPFAWRVPSSGGAPLLVGPDGCIAPGGELLVGESSRSPRRVRVDRVARRDFPTGVAHAAPFRRSRVELRLRTEAGGALALRVADGEDRTPRIDWPEDPPELPARPASAFTWLRFLDGGRCLAAQAGPELLLFAWPGGELLGRSPPGFLDRGLPRPGVAADQVPVLEANGRYLLGPPQVARPPAWEADLAFHLLDLRSGASCELVAPDLPRRAYHCRALAPGAEAVLVAMEDGEVRVYRPRGPLGAVPPGGSLTMALAARFPATGRGADALCIQPGRELRLAVAAEHRDGVVSFALDGSRRGSWPGASFSEAMEVDRLRDHPTLGLLVAGPGGVLALAEGESEPLRLGPIATGLAGFALDPSGRRLALALPGDLVEVLDLWVPPGLPPRRIAALRRPSGAPVALELSPEGGHLLLAEGRGIRQHELPPHGPPSVAGPPATEDPVLPGRRS